jgi:hypothetical protein
MARHVFPFFVPDQIQHARAAEAFERLGRRQRFAFLRGEQRQAKSPPHAKWKIPQVPAARRSPEEGLDRFDAQKACYIRLYIERKRMLRNWEHGRKEPDAAARAFLVTDFLLLVWAHACDSCVKDAGVRCHARFRVWPLLHSRKTGRAVLSSPACGLAHAGLECGFGTCQSGSGFGADRR